LRAGYSFRFEPVEAARARAHRRSGSAPRLQLLHDPAEGDTIFSPLRIFAPITGRVSPLGRRLRGLGPSSHNRT